jgi:hypothetical protein
MGVPALRVPALRAAQVRDIFASALLSTRDRVWGWLQPGSGALPHVLLRGDELALGRGGGGEARSEGSRTQVPAGSGDVHNEGEGVPQHADGGVTGDRWTSLVSGPDAGQPSLHTAHACRAGGLHDRSPALTAQVCKNAGDGRYVIKRLVASLQGQTII